MNRLISVVAAALLLGTFSGCTKKGAALRVDKVEPEQGISSGGDQVIIQGAGFEPGKTQATVRFGRKKAEQVAIASDSTIAVVTPAGDKGPVDVTVEFDDGASFKIPNGFRYQSPGGAVDVRNAFFAGKPGAAPSAAPAAAPAAAPDKK